MEVWKRIKTIKKKKFNKNRDQLVWQNFTGLRQKKISRKSFSLGVIAVPESGDKKKIMKGLVLPPIQSRPLVPSRKLSLQNRKCQSLPKIDIKKIRIQECKKKRVRVAISYQTPNLQNSKQFQDSQRDLNIKSAVSQRGQEGQYINDELQVLLYDQFNVELSSKFVSVCIQDYLNNKQQMDIDI